VVLVGGSTLMPQVPRMLEKNLGQKPSTEVSPHTAVAQGAAIHAAILEVTHRGAETALAETIRKRLEKVRQRNVNSHGLGVLAHNPKNDKHINHVMIPRNTPLPAEVTRSFKTQREGQDRVSIQVIEGDAPDPRACSLLGKFRIRDLPPGLPKGSLVDVTYAFDASGRIRVSAKERTGGKAASIEIDRRGNLDEQQIDVFRQLASEYQVE